MAKRKKTSRNADLQDSEHDRERMQPEETTMNLPEVKDIPGQEHVRPPRIREMEDTTISSDDEEGKGILDEINDDITDENPNVTRSEREMLEKASQTMPTRDQKNLDSARVDNRDQDDAVLNERSRQSGEDLDVPGSELDDENENIGEEDEENNYYSRSDD